MKNTHVVLVDEEDFERCAQALTAVIRGEFPVNAIFPSAVEDVFNRLRVALFKQ